MQLIICSMENNRKLELTLCGMLPYGLKIQLCDDKREDFEDEDWYDADKFKFGAEWELVGYNFTKDLNIPLGEGELEGMLLKSDMTYCNFKHYVLPKLHSMDKLTEPILENSLIPIVELAKMIYPQFDSYFDIQKFPLGDNDFGYYVVREYLNGTESFTLSNGFFQFNRQYVNDFKKEIDFDLAVRNQLELFEKLKEWHFNIYDLPKEMYIEKSTLNS